MSIQKTITLYTYEELPPDSKEVALNWYKENNTFDIVESNTYKFAKSIGFNISHSMIKRGFFKYGNPFVVSEFDCARILLNIGNVELQKIANTYLQSKHLTIDDGYIFKMALTKFFEDMLNKEIELFESDKNCINAITNGKYYFRENGTFEEVMPCVS